MNADAFRHVYEYHFAENRKIWNHVLALSDEQFTQLIDYSLGSVKNHVVHMLSVDEVWFSGLRGVELAEFFEPEQFPNREAIRAQWDKVEHTMRDYLANLRDETLFAKPFPKGEDENLTVWPVLLQVINHGTDHRAQLLRILHDFGLDTRYQDYIFYVYEHMV